MSRKQSNYKRGSLGEIINVIHKHSPKTMLQEQNISAANKKKAVLIHNWKGASRLEKYNYEKDLIQLICYSIMITILIAILLVIFISGCAKRPDIMKTKHDCLYGKVHKIGSIYVCLEVGGDVKK